MSVLGRKRIRIAIDTSKSEAQIDLLTGGTPEIWRSKDVQFELGLFRGSDLINPSNFASITATVKPRTNRTGNHVLPQRTINSGSINSGLLLADWNAGTDQHGIVSWTNSETAVDLGGATDLEYWMFFAALTNDNPGRAVPLGFTILKISEPGDSSGSSPAPGDPNYYTATQSDARYPQKLSFIINSANVTGGLISGLTNPLTITHNKNTKDWTHKVYRVDDDSPVDTALTPHNVNTASLALGVVPGDGEFRFVGFYL